MHLFRNRTSGHCLTLLPISVFSIEILTHATVTDADIGVNGFIPNHGLEWWNSVDKFRDR